MEVIIKQTIQTTVVHILDFSTLPSLHGWRIDDFKISSEELKLAIQKHGDLLVLRYIQHHLLTRMKPK